MITIKPVYNRKNKLDRKGLGNVELRLTLNRKPTYFNTKIKITPEHWDYKSNRVKKQNENWFEFNQILEGYINKTEKYNVECLYQKKTFNIDLLKKILAGENDKANDKILAFIDNEIEQRKDLAKSTISHHKSKLLVLQNFLVKDILIKDIDYSVLQAYNNHLINKGYSINTRWNHHKFLKTYLNIAIKHNLISINPYKNFKVETEQTKREYLTLEEIKRIEQIELEPEFKSHQLVIDKFLFSCYTGLRISDLQALKNDFFVTEGEKVYLSFRMQKTVKLIRNMPLHQLFNGKAINIYKKYSNISKNTTLFPYQSEQKINEKLKDIAKLANIDKKITFHVARHSFGSALARVYNDVLLIKELMGHSKLETSMIYIHMNPEIIENKLSQKKFEY